MEILKATYKVHALRSCTAGFMAVKHALVQD